MEIIVYLGLVFVYTIFAALLAVRISKFTATHPILGNLYAVILIIVTVVFGFSLTFNQEHIIEWMASFK